MSQIARFSIPSGWGEKNHSPIIGQLFDEVSESKFLKKDTVYAIVEIGGELILKELGPAALESEDGGKHYGWQIQSIMTHSEGTYVMTKKECQKFKK